MEFDDVVRKRRMIRRYDPDRPLPPELVDKIVKHALRAPSAGFAQGWGFLVLSEPADRDLYWQVATQEPAEPVWRGDFLTQMRTAPLIIACFANKSVYLERYAEADKGWTDRDEARWPVPYWDIDTGFAALLMHLTAVSEGLGSCFFGIPPVNIPPMRQAFGVPDEFNPIGALTVGHRVQDEKSPSLKRGHRPVQEVVHRGRWSAPGA
jgi:nitroreductase